MMKTDQPIAAGQPTESEPQVRCKEWLECVAQLKKMSHEHKAIHEKSKDQWERAYHLGAAVALQDAQMEVLSAAIVKHSNGGADLQPPPNNQKP